MPTGDITCWHICEIVTADNSRNNFKLGQENLVPLQDNPQFLTPVEIRSLAYVMLRVMDKQ
jgi:hypothetical protein